MIRTPAQVAFNMGITFLAVVIVAMAVARLAAQAATPRCLEFVVSAGDPARLVPVRVNCPARHMDDEP